ncbi:NHL repeat-containing protein [Thiohalomonas denitrificans]|uniref:NHL repeat-containing protein n=1 Tax=Thiohalomonas denitrificans TaxID=415747 RepID=UPI0026F025B2|nr:NHL repeat-containing protein [Thiohalomonas denitrificans]
MQSAELQLHLEQTKEGPLSLPSDVEIGPLGRVWVVDSGNHRLVAFDSDGLFLFTVGKPGNSEGELQGPLGLGIDQDGNVYVADAGNFRIQVFSREGKFIAALPLEDRDGPIRPADVAVGKGGALFMTANTRHKVFKLNPDGRPITSWGNEGISQGEFRYPATIVVNKGLVYVVDVLNTRVQIFDEKGKFRYQIGDWGVSPGQLFRPKGVAVDENGRAYVSDSYMDLVQVYGSGYKFDHVIGKSGTIQQFTAPTGLAIDSANRLYVCEMLAHRVSVRQLQ